MTTEDPSTAPTGTTGTTTAPPRALLRCTSNRMLGGVCAGVAEAVGLDVTVVRIAAVVLALIGGLAVPAYLAAWVLVPDEDTNTAIAEQLVGHPGRW